MITGLQKMTLLDYPGKVACTVFLQGCNFRCPFCHNSPLLGAAKDSAISRQELMAFLQKRQKLLDGVCVTGGEPTLCPELPELLKEIKALGYAVKLDTNGSNPEILKQLADDGLIDYVAMDIKNCPSRYRETAGCQSLDLEKIQESMTFLMEGALDYEFRTTVVQEFHTAEDIAAIGKWFQALCPGKKVKKYFLQPFVESDSVLTGGLHAPNTADLLAFLDAAKSCVHAAEIRGVQL